MSDPDEPPFWLADVTQYPVAMAAANWDAAGVNDWRDPEAAWWAKSRRARTHIDDIKAMLIRFDEDTACRVDLEPTSEAGKTALRLRVLRRPPNEILTTIGDALHNLRSCLDSVAFELASRTLGGTMTEKQQKSVQFPTCVDKEEFDASLAQKNQRDLYGEHERSALQCAQPFTLRHEAAAEGVVFGTAPAEEYRINELVRLSRLNNLDKHRYLPLLSWYMDFAYFTSEVAACRLDVRMRVPLQDGEVFGHLLFDPGQIDPGPALHLEMRLTFADDPGYAAGISDSLDNWHRYLTSWIVPRIFIVADGNPPPIMIAG